MCNYLNIDSPLHSIALTDAVLPSMKTLFPTTRSIRRATQVPTLMVHSSSKILPMTNFQTFL